jgi:hypothetical protein
LAEKTEVWLKFYSAIQWPEARANTLLPNAYPINAKSQGTPAPRTTFDIKRACFARGPIRVEWIAIGLLVVFIAGEIPARANADDLTAGLYAFATRRAVGVV